MSKYRLKDCFKIVTIKKTFKNSNSKYQNLPGSIGLYERVVKIISQTLNNSSIQRIELSDEIEYLQF
nr:hypothetical protein [uncultured Flavobacterium sp.]